MSKVHILAADEPLNRPLWVRTLCEQVIRKPEIVWTFEGDLRDMGEFSRLGNCSKCAAKEVKGRYVYGIREVVGW